MLEAGAGTAVVAAGAGVDAALAGAISPMTFAFAVRSWNSAALIRGCFCRYATIAQIVWSSWEAPHAGIAVIFNSTVLLFNAIMQAHGDVTTPVINMIIGGIVKVAVNYILVGIPALNIVGASIGTVVCYLTRGACTKTVLKKREVFQHCHRAEKVKRAYETYYLCHWAGRFEPA